MVSKFKLTLLAMVVGSGVGGFGCTGGSEVLNNKDGGSASGGSTGSASGGATNSGGSSGTGTGGSSTASGGSGSGSGGSSTGSGGSGSGTGGSESGSGGVSETGSGGSVSSGGATGSGGSTTGSGGSTTGSGGAGVGGGKGGSPAMTTGSGGTAPTGPINVLVWNNALAYGHAARGGAIPYLQKRESTDNLKFDLTYAHPSNVSEGPSDTSFDASVFTDAGLDKYDVVLFLDTTGTTIDDSMKTVRRQALQDFIEKKGRGFVGTHSATDTYQGSSWPWYVNFIGANFKDHSNAGTAGTAQYYQMMTHPILTAAMTPNPWNRSEEWYTLTRDPLSSTIPGMKILLTCHDNQKTEERASAWIHEMPIPAGGTRAGRMFYTAFGHSTSAFNEKPVMDMLVAAIKWAAYRL